MLFHLNLPQLHYIWMLPLHFNDIMLAWRFIDQLPHYELIMGTIFNVMYKKSHCQACQEYWKTLPGMENWTIMLLCWDKDTHCQCIQRSRNNPSHVLVFCPNIIPLWKPYSTVIVSLKHHIHVFSVPGSSISTLIQSAS